MKTQFRFRIVYLGGDEYQIVDRETKAEFCTVTRYEGEAFPPDYRATMICAALNAPITDATAEPQEFFKITSVSRDDLEAQDYNTKHVDDATMQRLAERMGEAYTGSGGYWIDLEIIADDLGIPKRRTKRRNKK